MLESRFSHRGVPELDTTSTADISFILLIFFLITTSLSVEMGMRRTLPPMASDREEPQVVSKENLMTVDILANHVVMCNNEQVSTTALAERIKSFADNKEHVINIRTADNAMYEDYFEVHQTIMKVARGMKVKIRISENEYPMNGNEADSGAEGGKGAER